VFAEAAGVDDAPELAEIEGSCVGSGWSERAFAREAEAAGSSLVVLRAPRAGDRAFVVAAYVASRVAADEMELLSLAVRPEWRRLGLGRWLVNLALSMAMRRGALKAFLEVRAGNEAARQLYGLLGFQEADRRPRYYREPVDDAILLTRALPTQCVRRDS
jgi:[ribosomal protein S18]-alanine N-acetyltransferase